MGRKDLEEQYLEVESELIRTEIDYVSHLQRPGDY